MISVKNIDLWNDHKPSQSIDPFIIDYFDKEKETFEYDKVILAPNLCGNYQVINHGTEIDPAMCPEFNGGIIFLKNGEPIRLYLCQTNEILTKNLGYNYGIRDIVKALRSNEKIEGTNKTLSHLLKQNRVKVTVDNSIKSKYVSEKGYNAKNDPVLESADCMKVLKSQTFLDNINNWECADFYPDIIMNLGVVGQDFEIDIEHKGYIIGVKQNINGLRESQKGKKVYGIALQTANKRECAQMVEFTKNFTRQVGIAPSKETREINLAESLLDLK